MKYYVRLFLIVCLGWSGVSLSAATTSTVVDVSGQVQIKKSGLVLNRVTKTFNTTLTLTNTTLPVNGPLTLSVSGLPTGVTLANVTGSDVFQNPSIQVPLPQGTLPIGGVVNNVLLTFNNPGKIQFTYLTHVFGNVMPMQTPTATLTTIDDAGGTIDLPGIATLNVSQGTTQSTAIQVSTINSPALTALISNSTSFKPLIKPQLQIKSSVPLQHPVELIIPYPTIVQELNGGSVSVASHIKVDEDSDDLQDSIELIPATICGNQDSVCVTLSPAAFSPVPNDPNDPVIDIALVSQAQAKNPLETDILNIIKVDPYLVNPTISPVVDTNPNSVVDVYVDTTPQIFKATVHLKYPAEGTGLNVHAGTPYIGGITRSSFASSFKLLRGGKPHKGVDLLKGEGTEIKNIDDNSFIQAIGREDGTDILGHWQSPLVQTCGDLPPMAEDFSKPVTWDQRLIHTLVTYNGYTGNIYSFYRHLSKFYQSPCDLANAGDLIALSGKTGTWYSDNPGVLPKRYHPHLHMEIGLASSGLSNQAAIDPRPLLLKDMGQYLLPKDFDDAAHHSQDVDNGMTFYWQLRVDGKNVNRAEKLSMIAANDLINISTPQEAGGANITSKPGPNGSTIDLTPLDVKINLVSNPIDLYNMLTAVAVNRYGATLSDFFKSNHKVTVGLSFCSFRLNYCHPLTEWKIGLATLTLSVDGAGSVTYNQTSRSGRTACISTDSPCVEEFGTTTATSQIVLTAVNPEGTETIFAYWTGLGAENCTALSAYCVVTFDPTNTNPPTIKASLVATCAVPPTKVGNLLVQRCDYQNSNGYRFFNWQDAMTVAQSYGPGWHLPTKDELTVLSLADEVYTSSGRYWSSTEYNSYNSWYSDLTYIGVQGYTQKDIYYMKVRAVRAF